MFSQESVIFVSFVRFFELRFLYDIAKYFWQSSIGTEIHWIYPKRKFLNLKKCSTPNDSDLVHYLMKHNHNSSTTFKDNYSSKYVLTR